MEANSLAKPTNQFVAMFVLNGNLVVTSSEVEPTFKNLSRRDCQWVSRKKNPRSQGVVMGAHDALRLPRVLGDLLGGVASQVLATHAASMEPSRHPVIDALDQPREGVIGCRKHHVVLQHVVEVDEPPPVMVEDGNGSPAVDVGDELFLADLLLLHGQLHDHRIQLPVCWAYPSAEQRVILEAVPQHVVAFGLPLALRTNSPSAPPHGTWSLMMDI
jgi:hypothetical protein